MQRLVLENGKLVAYTDNGRFDGDVTSTIIQEDFIVNSSVVKLLMSDKNHTPIYGEIWANDKLADEKNPMKHLANVTLLNSDDVIYNLIQKHVNARKIAEKRYEKLIKDIEKFNKERRFYEREFNLNKYK